MSQTNLTLKDKLLEATILYQDHIDDFHNGLKNGHDDAFFAAARYRTDMMDLVELALNSFDKGCGEDILNYNFGIQSDVQREFDNLQRFIDSEKGDK